MKTLLRFLWRAARVSLLAGALSHLSAAASHGSMILEHFTSKILAENETGLATNRSISIYLPPSYSTSGKAYPVLYYCHNINWSNERMFADGNLQRLLDRAWSSGAAPEFIFVAADYTTSTMGSWFQNSPVTGRWLDYTVDEVVPFVDGHFRTIRHRDSRGVAGDFVGGRGALVLATMHPETFSVVYALHPVATGTGWVPMASHPNWRTIHEAKTLSDLGADGFARAYVAIHQAFLPNPARPPFHCDFMMEMENGEPRLHHENAAKLKGAFLLDHMLEEFAANLRTMRGIAFDWARYDPNLDHVYSNQSFTRKLDELGIEHEAEEYRGDPWNKTWTEHGRFSTRLIPFVGRHLVVDP